MTILTLNQLSNHYEYDTLFPREENAFVLRNIGDRGDGKESSCAALNLGRHEMSEIASGRDSDATADDAHGSESICASSTIGVGNVSFPHARTPARWCQLSSLTSFFIVVLSSSAAEKCFVIAVADRI